MNERTVPQSDPTSFLNNLNAALQAHQQAGPDAGIHPVLRDAIQHNYDQLNQIGYFQGEGQRLGQILRGHYGIYDPTRGDRPGVQNSDMNPAALLPPIASAAVSNPPVGVSHQVSQFSTQVSEVRPRGYTSAGTGIPHGAVPIRSNSGSGSSVFLPARQASTGLPAAAGPQGGSYSSSDHASDAAYAQGPPAARQAGSAGIRPSARLTRPMGSEARIVPGSAETQPMEPARGLRPKSSTADPGFQQRLAMFRNYYNEAKAAGDAHPEVLAAQLAWEGGWKATPTGNNNLLGIKKRGGKTVPTWEEVNGKRVNTTAQFRNFDSPKDALKYRVHMTDNPKGRYASRGYLNQGTEAGLNALQQGGYASDTHYAKHLRSLIKEYGFYVPTKPEKK